MIWWRNITILLRQHEIDHVTSLAILINYEIIYGTSV